jgi:hypothetical protein
VTGRHRNPLLHGVSEERQQLVAVAGKTPAELLEEGIEQNRLLLGDLAAELEAVKMSPKKWVWLGSTYTRQEGDGALMGTGRIAQRKRMPKLEAIARLTKDIASVQRVYNKMVKDLHDMLKGGEPDDPQAGLRALKDAIKQSAETIAAGKKGNGGQGGAGGESA